MAAAAFKEENYYDRIRVFERRESAGGSWFVKLIFEFLKSKWRLTFGRIYDADPRPHPPLQPGKLAGDVDPPLETPDGDLKTPHEVPPNQQERYSQTPVYNNLT